MRSRMMLTACLATVLLSSSAMASLSLGNCWGFSPPANDECGYGLVCVEWDDDGIVMATDCCQMSELDNLGCYDHCVPVPLDRPVATLPVAPEPQIRQGLKPQKAFSAPIRVLPTPSEEARPELSVLFDGIRHSPEAFAELDLPEVHYLFRLDDGTGRSTLFAFATWQELTFALWQTGDFDPRPFSKAEAASVLPASSGVTLFEGEMWKGPAARPAEGRAFDLVGSPWDRSFSSLKGSGPGWVTFFDQTGLEGCSLTLSTAWDRPSLKPFGWNDRISSGFIWPRRPLVQPLKAPESDNPKP